MSRLEIPITGTVLFATGDVKLRAEIDLELKDAAGHWHTQTFRVDTGTELTTFPARDARRLGLPLPQHTSPGAVHTQTGQPFRSGFLRFRVGGMDGTEYAVGCLFLGDPTAAGPPATFPRKLVQPFQLLDWLRFAAGKDPALGNLYGEMVVEKK
jgi:hypothetical protein